MKSKNNIKILIACEESGVVTDAFMKLGFRNTYSCDLLPTSGIHPENHFQMDIFELLSKKSDWDLMIAHPDCRFLTVTANKWMRPEYRDRFPDRINQREEAIEFFMKLYNMNIQHIAIENPVGIMSSRFRKPDQYIHPYHFGDPHSKKTGLWLKNLPKLTPTNIVEPQFYVYKNGKREPTWSLQTIRLPKEERSRARSKTFFGIAQAMASQWSEFILKQGE